MGKKNKMILSELRVRIPENLMNLFRVESEKERRKHSEQLAKILEDRYLTGEK